MYHLEYKLVQVSVQTKSWKLFFNYETKQILDDLLQMLISFQLCFKLNFRYFTWENHGKMEIIKNPNEKHAAHEKFANYRFNKVEFLRITQKAVANVREQLNSAANLRGGRRVHDEM